MGIRRAADVFRFEERGARSPMVERVWRTTSAPEQSFLAVAASHWEMVATRQEGPPQLAVLGPATRATAAPIPEGAEFLGIHFSLGTFMPSLAPGRLVDGGVSLTAGAASSVWLDGYRLEVPRSDDVDAFVAKLVRLGLLVQDPIIGAAVGSDLAGVSVRSIERRVSRATGLTRGAIRQIRRAETAVGMLTAGVSPIEVAHLAGYADQPHLTRSLKRFIGQTPAEIRAGR
jgi:Helix-turn-helix domain